MASRRKNIYVFSIQQYRNKLNTTNHKRKTYVFSLVLVVSIHTFRETSVGR